MNASDEDVSSEEPPRRFVLVESDPFDADRDQAILSFNRVLGPERAQEWAVGLARTLIDLLGFPGPLSHPQDEEAAAFYGRAVRRLLYYGPTRRRSGKPMRLLFTLLPPGPDEPPETAETVIFLLRLLHGAQSLQPDDPPE